MSDDPPAMTRWTAVRDTGRALLSLLGASWSVRRRPRGGGVSLPSTAAGPGPAEEGGPGRDAADGASPAHTAGARRVARGVDRACRLLPWEPSCLVRAVALKRLLRARGLPAADVRVGVRRQDGRFSAHAWVEVGGEVVGDSREHVARYERLADLEVFPE